MENDGKYTRQQDSVRAAYAATVKQRKSCCVSGVPGEMLGYSKDQLKIATNSKKMLGSGNPVNLANLQVGESVLDLGSGEGMDCILAAEKVGLTGKVVGVDMTPEMLTAARKKAKDNNKTNIEFRLGEIEHLPAVANYFDVVISNCVINLSPDKQQVFKETYRVLRDGGRIAISDVVATQELPQSLKSAESLNC